MGLLKWLGGKTQLLDTLISLAPKEYNNYYEPFIGGGALLLGLRPEIAYINDLNKPLINVYINVKNKPEMLLKYVEELDNSGNDEDTYYLRRERFNYLLSENLYTTEMAALMLYLNKRCFNGLYRTNRKGLFNASYNKGNITKTLDKEILYDISHYLTSNVKEITCLDFEEACENVSSDDFVYFDSPYLPESKTADFNRYTSDRFTMNDHIRLSELFRHLDSIGVKLMLSNNDVPLVYELYNGYNILNINTLRRINNVGSKRNNGKEVIIMNY